MEQEIIGRDREIRTFKKLLASNKAEFLAVYGRRRVGKTFLIREYFKSHLALHFTGSYKTKTTTQLENFYVQYSRATKMEKETTVPDDWNSAFTYLANYLYSLQHRKRKQVVFIDELPWLNRPRSGFLSALEYFWNQHGSTMNNVLLVVCGSAASWMQNKILKSKGGLHNRVTKRIKLLPFNLYETALFCKHRNIKLTQYQIIQIYMVMGGIPFYLDELTPGKSTEQLIDEICFSSTGLLATEYEQLYDSLFLNADNHLSIVEALADHPYGMGRSKLLQESCMSEGGTFSRALEDLVESGFITKYKPFGKKKKDTTYRLIDLYSLFYLKFIKGHITNQSKGWKRITSQPKFIAWSGYAFENISLLHINQILVKLGLHGSITDTSSWQHKGNDETPGAQIDLLIDRRDGLINLCEAKFTSQEFIISKNYVATLRRKRSVFQHVTKTKKSVVTTLITTYPTIRNKYYLEEIQSEVTMQDLFKPN